MGAKMVEVLGDLTHTHTPIQNDITIITMRTDDGAYPEDVAWLYKLRGLCLCSSCLCCTQCVISLQHSEELSLTYLHTQSVSKGQKRGHGERERETSVGCPEGPKANFSLGERKTSC